MHNIAVGDIVRYTAFGDTERTVRVTRVYDDVKNGRPGFDGVIQFSPTVETLGEVWGYTEQIVSVVSTRVSL